ncbi:mandelate racemase/muconate lactonizing enzyme family protein [Candidatus Latescibacterota bacterium]
MSSHDSRRSFFKKTAYTGAVAAAMMSNMGSRLEQAVEAQPLSSSPSKLRVTSVDWAYLGGRLFVRVKTNQGIMGTGEGVDAIGGSQGLIEQFGLQIVNQNPLDIHRIFYSIRTRGIFGGAQSGKYISVLGTLEWALWDLAGKALGVPMYRLLGGKFRDKCRVYRDSADASEPKEVWAETCVQAMKDGWNAVKFDLDWRGDPHKLDPFNWSASPGEVERMVEQVAAAREAAGPYLDIAVDMHGRFDLPAALRVTKALEPYNLMWVEEPVPAENFDALREVTMSTSTPICVGENSFLAADFRKILEKRASDIIMPDMHKCGGAGESQRIANLAALYYVPFAPHSQASPLGAAGGAHVTASIPNHLVSEWHWSGRQQQWDNWVISDVPVLEKGYYNVIEKPGCGVELNDEYVKGQVGQFGGGTTPSMSPNFFTN